MFTGPLRTRGARCMSVSPLPREISTIRGGDVIADAVSHVRALGDRAPAQQRHADEQSVPHSCSVTRPCGRAGGGARLVVVAAGHPRGDRSCSTGRASPAVIARTRMAD